MYRRKIKNRKKKAVAEANLINQEVWLHDRIKAPNDANLALNLIKYNYLQMLEIQPTKNYENYKNFFSTKLKQMKYQKGIPSKFSSAHVHDIFWALKIKVLFCAMKSTDPSGDDELWYGWPTKGV